MSDEDGRLEIQTRDAIAFLTTHFAELERLKSEPSVERKWIDFGYDCRLGPEIVVQGEYLPIELLKLTAELEIGIGLSLCPALQPSDHSS